MAIYDPPNGEIDPRPRCTGHCCRSFSTEKPYKELKQEYERWQKDPNSSSVPNIEVIFPMLIPLGTYRNTEVFSCKHLGKDGNCTIYESRPQMCRDFPGPSPCPYKNCSSHGYQPRWKRAWNWLRD